MTLTLRSASTTTATTKGSALSHAEMDANWLHLAQSSGVEFLQSGSGAVARTAQSKAQDLVSAKDFGVLGDGSTDDGTAIGVALSAVATATGTLYFPKGTYNYATSPNFARAGVNIYCDRGVIFNHTGTGNAFSLDGGAAGSGILGNRYDNITVQGNANSTNGMYLRSMHHCTFVHPKVRGCATTGSGFLLEWCVLNTWINPTVSSNDATLSPIPKYGMYLTRRSGTDHTTTQLLENPIFEGLTQTGGAGLYIDFAGGTTVTGGTSEGNTNGVIITANSYGLNSFNGLDLESNTSYDFDIASGTHNTFLGIYGLGTSRFTGTSNRNAWVGGRINAIDMGASTAYNTFLNVYVVTTFTDASAAPAENEWINCTLPSAAFMTSKFRGGTASNYTPAAYSTSITINAREQDIALISGTDGVDFDVNAPTNPTRGQKLTITIANASGGVMGAPVFNAVFKTGAAWTKPANGTNRSIQFYYNGTNWVEIGRSAADVTN